MSYPQYTPRRAPACVSALLAAAVLLGASFGYAAPISAVQFSTTGVTANSYNMQSETDGWIFTVNQTISVTSLGIFDSGGAGLADAHEVGLWSTASFSSYTGTLLSSITVPEGTTATLAGNFRYSSITPITLTPGTFYVIGAHYSGVPGSGGGSIDTDPDRDGHRSEFTSSGETYASAINFLGPRLSGQQTTGLQFPGGNFPGSYPELGPNFQFVAPTRSVPDSLPFAVLATAVMSVLALDFTLRRRACRG